MKVPVYRSKAELTTKSGSVFNPGVQVPYQLADMQAKTADILSEGLNATAAWALKKQDLADKTEATKAKSYYENELQAFRNRILHPRDEVDPTLKINLFKATPKQREKMWQLGMRTLREQAMRRYGTEIGGRTARSALVMELNTVDTDQTNTFNNVINKRVVQQAAAAGFKRQDDRRAQLSDPLLPLAKRATLIDEQSVDWREQVNGGLQTAKQIDKRKKDFREEVIKNLMDNIAQQNTDQEGIVKRSWLKQLRDNPKQALANSPNAFQSWMEASDVERREMIEELEKQRGRQLDIANDEAKAKERQADEAIDSKFLELYEAPDQKDRKRIFGELETLMKNSPGSSNITALEKARKFAFTGESDRYGDNDAFERLSSQMYDLATDTDGNTVPVVTRSAIMAAKLVTNQRTTLLNMLRTAKDSRARAGKGLIKNAAGLVGDVEDALTDEDSVPVMTVLAAAEAEFDSWFQLNRDKNQAEILAKGQEIADKVRGQVGAIYIGTYNDKKRSVSTNRDFVEMLKHPSVNGDIEAMFNDTVRDDVIANLMQNKPKKLRLNLDAHWRAMTLRRLNVLKTLARQAGVLQ